MSHPTSQGEQGSCVGFATAYSARTILFNIKNNTTDSDFSSNNAFSPSYVYNQIKMYDCGNGSRLTDALKLLQNQGCLPVYKFLYDSKSCNKIPSVLEKENASDFKILDYRSLKDDGEISINKIKKALYSLNPVVISIDVYQSFQETKGDLWNGVKDVKGQGHAISIVGYDDERYGGVFELMNSWDNDWADNGFVCVKYTDLLKICDEAYELIESSNTSSQEFSANVTFVLQTSDKITMNQISPNVFQSSEPLISGTNMQILLDNHQPMYLYIFSTDDTRKVQILFPPDDKISPLMPYQNNPIVIPGEDYFAQMDNTIGTDVICILYSKKKLDFQNLQIRLDGMSGELYSNIKYILGNKILSASEVKCNSSNQYLNTNFSAKSATGEMLLVSYRFKHH
ncbi:MAG: DUF4384 domain-containing protein [Bacteroidetes bacterium]|nr:DUF4384 domain-containing protein [Bacteroidota bacterium]